jgi:predicted nucleic-acid-binding protein
MPTLDTNCVLRWLVRVDPVATAKVDTLVSVGRSMRVPDVVVIEAVYVMENYYRFTRNEVSQAIRLVLGQAVFELDRSLWDDVMDTYLKRPKLSVTDIFLSVDAERRNKAPLLTFDKKVINQLGAVSP